MTSPPRFFLLIQLDPIGGVLGIFADASTDRHRERVWGLVHEETLLCHELFDTELLPEVGPRPGMLCICAEYPIDGCTGGPAPDSPAPAWRRPTLDEMIAIIEGKTPPFIRAWLDGTASA